ncbi:MAG: PH domain-containing protein [Opitutaceae bacterium]|nr:PH domain-containing protein [Opitutaceae bacterium]
MHPPAADAGILTIERPHQDLLTYYVISSLAAGPLFLVPLIYRMIRFRTMRYRFSSEGLSMSWGILFRREIIIQYARIQDIHLRSNVVERWLGLARVLIQTASGSASAEMTLEGLKEFEAVRDFLYHRMRGVREHPGHAPAVALSGAPMASASSSELAGVLAEIAAELRGLRADLAARKERS